MIAELNAQSVGIVSISQDAVVLAATILIAVARRLRKFAQAVAALSLVSFISRREQLSTVVSSTSRNGNAAMSLLMTALETLREGIPLESERYIVIQIAGESAARPTGVAARPAAGGLSRPIVIVAKVRPAASAAII